MTGTRNKYRLTIYACYLSYIIQGIINNISPILFATYQRSLGITLEEISVLIAVNFGVQIMVDMASAKYVDKCGYRKSMVFAHVMSVIGLAGIGIFPLIMNNPFPGLVISTILNGVGGGLLEVLVSPLVEALPGKEKEKTMSMLHSFYCWGCVGFILISTVMLHILGDMWYIMPVIWMILPIANTVAFFFIPIKPLKGEEGKSNIMSLAKLKVFWLCAAMMLCAGAAEMAMSQWAAYFAETSLKVSRTVGNLLGPCSFSLLMGVSRLFYGKWGHKIKLERFMAASCVLCVISYLTAGLSGIEIISLIGCAVCGLAVGIMWPGTYSIAAVDCRTGGTAMFALLAFAGDIGCVSGPEVVGVVAGAMPEYGFKAGLFAAAVFPAAMLVIMREIKKLRISE